LVHVPYVIRFSARRPVPGSLHAHRIALPACSLNRAHISSTARATAATCVHPFLVVPADSWTMMVAALVASPMAISLEDQRPALAQQQARRHRRALARDVRKLVFPRSEFRRRRSGYCPHHPDHPRAEAVPTRLNAAPSVGAVSAEDSGGLAPSSNSGNRVTLGPSPRWLSGKITTRPRAACGSLRRASAKRACATKRGGDVGSFLRGDFARGQTLDRLGECRRDGGELVHWLVWPLASGSRVCV
jgi:hypothetical protein